LRTTPVLRIRIEIVPGGVGRPRELARAELGNISGLADRSDYGIFAWEDHNDVAGTLAWDSRGIIAGHARRQTVWKLVEAAAAFCVRAAQEAEKL
jgi:hypothetical protein